MRDGGKTCDQRHPATEAAVYLIQRAVSIDQGIMQQGTDGLLFIAAVFPDQAADGHEMSKQGGRPVFALGIAVQLSCPTDGVGVSGHLGLRSLVGAGWIETQIWCCADGPIRHNVCRFAKGIS